MDLASRIGANRPQPERSRREEAPPALRTFLREHLVEERGLLGAYRWACDQLGIEAEDIWSPSWAGPRLRSVIADADWLKIFDLIEAAAPDGIVSRQDYSDALNAVLAREGLAYEFSEGEVIAWNPAAAELGLDEVVDGAVSMLTGRLEPAGEQFKRAVTALQQKPYDGLGAVRESLNAVEATAKILADSRPAAGFKEAVTDLFSERKLGHERALVTGLTAMYGYASQVPGSRHGQHTTVEVSFAEASLSVNLMGSVIAYLVTEFDDATRSA